MHLSMSDEMHAYNLEDYEKEVFEPIVKESKKLNQEITRIFKATGDIESDIADIAFKGEYDLVLVGLGKSIFEGTILGKVLGFTTSIINPDRLLDKFTGKEGLFENSPFDDRTRLIISKTKIPLGILIDKELNVVNKVFVPIFSLGDVFLIDYAQKLIYNNDSKVTIVDKNSQTKNNFIIENAVSALNEKYPNNMILLDDDIFDKSFLAQQDLIIVSLESWKNIINEQKDWLSNVPSVLIIKP
jgi:hypothetical protein